ncbi:MAG: diacylglycerol kinase [Burkholderiales bacterium]
MREIDLAESPHKGQRGLRRLFNAFLYSLSGLALALRHESAFRQEVALAAVLIPLACLLDVTSVERVLLIASVLFVLVVELLNSSVEAAIDRIGFDTHRLSKRAKDLGSAAVLVSLVALGFVWLVLAGPAMLGAMRATVGTAQASEPAACRIVDENPVMREIACDLQDVRWTPRSNGDDRAAILCACPCATKPG